MLGQPSTPDEWAAWASYSEASTGVLTDYGLPDADIKMVKGWIPGRWDFAPRGREPSGRTARPIDLFARRAQYALFDIGPMPARPGAGVIAAQLYHPDTRHYWAPGDLAGMLAQSDPPDTEALATLRLPHQHTVMWFARSVALGQPPEALMSDDEAAWVASRATVRGDTITNDAPRPAELLWIHTRQPLERVAIIDGTPEVMLLEDEWQTPTSSTRAAIRVEGLIIHAGPDGRPAPFATWLLADHRTSTERTRPVRFGIPAFTHRSWWSDVIETMTAAIAWGDWQDREWERPKNKNRLRSLLALNVDLAALAPYRMLDPRRYEPAPERAEPKGGTHASPVTHLRRGHWTTVRTGPGRTNRERRWIAPVVVNPGAETDKEIVWRMPPARPPTPRPEL